MPALFKYILPLLAGIIISILQPGTSLCFAESDGETLFIVTQTDDNPVESHFIKEIRPEIKTIATGMGIKTVILHGSGKLPENVGITPLLIFQNYRGRSVYQGRTTSLKRISNFLRTSRRIPQGKEVFQLRNTPVWRTGRAFIWSPLKISSLGGTLPKLYDESDFQVEAFNSILKGFKNFRLKKAISAGRSDRGFYMDFYPWLAKDDTLYLSLALFSQFHCKKPVFTHKLTGTWKKRSRLFKQAAKTMEAEIARQIENPVNGDGFSPVQNNVQTVSWSNLGYTLPPPLWQTPGRFPNQLPFPSHGKQTIKRITAARLFSSDSRHRLMHTQER